MAPIIRLSPEEAEEDLHENSSDAESSSSERRDSIIVSDLLYEQEQPAKTKPTARQPRPPFPGAVHKARGPPSLSLAPSEEGTSRLTSIRVADPISESDEPPVKRRRSSGSNQIKQKQDPPSGAKKRGRPGKQVQGTPGISKPITASEKKKVSSSKNNEPVWEVEQIVGSRIEADTYIHYYEVKWKGWSAKHNTWEPKKNLTTCRDLIELFEKGKKKDRKMKKKNEKMGKNDSDDEV